tara:strand:+ start:254 stop:964 length:711 start_codon:yes stop_codon:yes gene_type:complete
MPIKTIKNYSPNFYIKKRLKKNIKLIIIHYTGMKSEKAAEKRLLKIQSEVSSHFLIKKNGDIIVLVPELYVAWHAGRSFWRGMESLNSKSIGIEITNPGHSFGYKNFSYKQIKSLKKLIRYLLKKYKINKKDVLGHSDVAPERKKDPGEKFPWAYLAKNKLSIWHNLSQNSLRKLRKKNCSKSERKIFIRNIIKIGYPINSLTKTIIAFQRRFRPELIDGKIDQECLKISKSIIKF